MKQLLLTALCCGLCSGCATEHGRCYPILGLGWVIVRTSPGVTAVKTTTVGASVSTLTGSAVVGFGENVFINATTNSNAILEIK